MVETLRAQGKEPMSINLTKRPGTEKLAKQMTLKEGRQV